MRGKLMQAPQSRSRVVLVAAPLRLISGLRTSLWDPSPRGKPMKLIVSTLSLFVLVFMTGSIIFAVTEALAPQVLSTNAKAEVLWD